MKRLAILLLVAAFSFLPLFMSVSVQAASMNPICEGNRPSDMDEDAWNNAGCGEDKKVEDYVATVMNTVFMIVGIISVFMIIWGGVRYSISAGDAAKVAAAKNTIIFAVVGLAVSMSAFAIVRFVVAKVNEAPKASSYSTEDDCVGAGHTWDGTTCK